MEIQHRKISEDTVPNNYSPSEESDESMKDSKKTNKIAKSEQKNKIVRNIFLNVSKSDSGAKGKGQVMIVGHADDTQKQITSIPRDNFQTRYTKKKTIPIVCKIDLSRLSRVPYERYSRINNSIKSPSEANYQMVCSLNANTRIIPFKYLLYVFQITKKIYKNERIEKPYTQKCSSSDSSVCSSGETRDSDDLENNDSKKLLTNHSKTNGDQNSMKSDLKSINILPNKLQNGLTFVLHNKVMHESRSDKFDSNELRNTDLCEVSPKMEEKHFNKINHECQRSELTTIDEKILSKLNGDTTTTTTISANIKKEHDKIKIENENDEESKICAQNIQINSKKRTSSVNSSSPYKEKKRKKMFEDSAIEEHLLLPTNHDRIISDVLPPPPPPQKPLKIYYSYFEKTNDDRDDIREMK